jgi:hypothetical protein
MILKKASKKAIKYSCLKFHYAKTLPAAGMGFSVFNDKNEWCGCIVYGRGANPYIASKYGLKQGQAMELVRMALNGKQESTSKALALSMKLFKKYNPTVKLLVSYADKGQEHTGVIYQATNWIYIENIKSSGLEYLYNGKWMHAKSFGNYKIKPAFKQNIQRRKKSGKFKYLYAFDKTLKEKLNKQKLTYPKVCDSSVNGSTLSVHDKSTGSIPSESLNNYA